MREIINQIKPTKEEENKTKKIISLFRKKLKRPSILGGSYAKGTHLRGNHDIDIFVPFKENTNISDTLQETLQVFNNVQRIPGSRDYFQVNYKGYTFEVVPIHRIKKIADAKNITDISPLHVTWVKKHSNAKLRDEIRLSKQFFKAHHLYGAETYIKGFSGYVLEILTIYYGSFQKLLKAATKWKEHQIIDPQKHKEGLNESKKSPLIIIDPVQKERNAAAALSPEQFQKAKSAAKQFLAHPAKEAFLIKHPTSTELKKSYDIVLEAKLKEGKKDTVATKAKCAAEYLQKRLTEEGFTIQDAYFHANTTALIAFKCASLMIEKTFITRGPPKEREENVKQFKAKHTKEKIFCEGSHLFVTRNRKYTEVKKAVQAILKETFVQQRTQCIKLYKPQ